MCHADPKRHESVDKLHIMLNQDVALYLTIFMAFVLLFMRYNILN